MIPLYETDGNSTMPLGMAMCQNRLAVPTWSYAMEKFPPARIVEIGTMNGGLTIALGVHAYHLGCKVTTYERSKSPDERFAALGAFLGITFRDQVDMWTLAGHDGEIHQLIAGPGRTFVLCDGGDKPRELATFARYLKPGDVIAGHDYCAQTGDRTPEDGDSAWWPWGELAAEQGAIVATENDLEPFLQEHFDMAGWLAYRKRGGRPVMAQREHRPAKDPIANPGSHGGAPRADTLGVIARNTGHSLAVVTEVFSERAAIREYLGGMSRADAEIKATQDTSALLHAVKP